MRPQDTTLGVYGVFPNSLLIAILGQIPVYPRWVICAIWINGSELLDPVFCFESDISSR